MLEPKTVAASHCVMTEIVLPNDTNGLGNLMGGRLLHWMDICAAISAQRHAQRTCVTASVDSVEFQSPIEAGEIVILESQVNRAFRTSMEVEINVWAENPRKQSKRKCNRAFYTFVALDDNKHPVSIAPISPETPDEEARYANAMKRREIRLVLSGRIQLEQASEIKQEFFDLLRRENAH